MEMQTKEQAKFSIPSIIGIICGIASFPTGALLGFILALAALVFGGIGILLAFSSRIRGGIISTLAVMAGLMGVIAAIVKGVAFVAQ